jgi:hypothetical protein
MARIEDTLEKLSSAAHRDDELRNKLIETENSKDPVFDFCDIATKAGYPIAPGELFALNQTMCDNLLKSTNGGATYPIDDWADTYEQFISSLKMHIGGKKC